VPGGPTNYTVKPGDRLFSIARQFGVSPYAIAQANRIGPPYIIYPSQSLTIPGGGSTGTTPVPGGTTYTVQSGDTVYSIGRKFARSPAAIINANNLVNPNHIFPGQVLTIP
jgi:LysM repeat protein